MQPTLKGTVRTGSVDDIVPKRANHNAAQSTQGPSEVFSAFLFHLHQSESSSSSCSGVSFFCGGVLLGKPKGKPKFSFLCGVFVLPAFVRVLCSHLQRGKCCWLRDPLIMRSPGLGGMSTDGWVFLRVTGFWMGESNKPKENHYGCGSKPMGSHFGVGAPPILVYFSEDWDLGARMAFDPWPYKMCHPILRFLGCRPRMQQLQLQQQMQQLQQQQMQLQQQLAGFRPEFEGRASSEPLSSLCNMINICICTYNEPHNIYTLHTYHIIYIYIIHIYIYTYICLYNEEAFLFHLFDLAGFTAVGSCLT